MPQGEPGGAANQGLVESLMAALGISRTAATKLLQDARAAGKSGQAAVEWAIRKWNQGGGGGGGEDEVPVIVDGTTVSGSVGGGVGSTGPDREAIRASYIGLLHSWKIPPREVEGLLDRAVNNTWTTNEFVNALRQTKVYKETFVGIGATNLSESAYNTKFFNFRDAAKDIGRGLTRAQFGMLLKRGVSDSEWAFRISAADSIRRNGALFNWYEAELKKRGVLRPKENLSYGEMWKIVTKQNSQQFERIYETAYLSSNLARAGFDFKGGDRDLSRKDLLKFIRSFETGTPGAEVEKLGAADFAALADDIENLIPMSALSGVGVTKGDLLELRLGGPRAYDIKQRVDTLRASFNLKQQGDTQPQLVQAEKGTRLLGYEDLAGEEGE